MGIIKATFDSARRQLGDQWGEIVKPYDLSDGMIATVGQRFRADSKETVNTKGTADVLSDGSIIYVPENTCMLLVQNGKVVDFTTEPGEYIIDNGAVPSILFGNIKENFKPLIKNTWERIRYGGTEPTMQKVVYISLKEIKGIKFGTPAPLPYHDANYDMDLEVTSHGMFSVFVRDPLRFYQQVLAADTKNYSVEDFDEQFRSEFIQAFSVALSSLSLHGVRISHLMTYGNELSQQMSNELDEHWLDVRGMEIESVAVRSISYTENSRRILDIRSEGSALQNERIREGYLQGSIARGMEAAGKNEAGAGNAFIGMGMGMGAAGQMMGQFSQTNAEQMKANQQKLQEDQNQEDNTLSPSQTSWTCPSCHSDNTGNFCSNCGTKKPEEKSVAFCTNCGNEFKDEKPKFCPNCGQKTE